MRPSWNKYFMEIAHLVKTRSTCIRRQVGAVVVKDKRILSTGYNGAPTNCKHCNEVGCLRAQLNVPSGERHELCRALHAEQNAIAQGAQHGISMKEATIYEGDYPDDLSSQLLNEAGITLTQFSE